MLWGTPRAIASDRRRVSLQHNYSNSRFYGDSRGSCFQAQINGCKASGELFDLLKLDAQDKVEYARLKKYQYC